MTSPKQPFNHKEMKRKLNRNVAVPFLEVTKDQGRTEEITAATWKRRIFRKVSRMGGCLTWKPEEGDSWKSSFSGSMLNFGDVALPFFL